MFIPTPWIGHFSDYVAKDGILIPRHAEVSWEIDGQMCPYFKGDITEGRFEGDESLDRSAAVGSL